MVKSSNSLAKICDSFMNDDLAVSTGSEGNAYYFFVKWFLLYIS